MSELLGFAQLLALVWLGFSLLIALALAWSLPRLILPRLERLSATRRGQWLWAICGAPLWGGLALCGLCLLPSALSLAWPAVDHCLDHTHHDHLCLVHGTQAPLRVVWLIPPILALLAVGWRLALCLKRHARAWAALGNLERLADFDAPTGAHLLKVDAPWAFVGGLIRQRIYMSRALCGLLSPEGLALVLAHERAHVQRRDNLRRMTAALISALHLPSTRGLLLDGLELACERACDDLAAPCELSRLRLAHTLLHLNRIAADSPAPRVAATSGATGCLEARIHALLNEPTPEGATAPPLASLRWPASVFFLICLLTEPLHHTTETLLSLLLG